MKPYSFLLLLLLSMQAFAQDHYDEIEASSKYISNTQFKLNGNIIIANDSKAKFEFSKMNFVVNLKDLTATQSCYLQIGDNTDTLYLYEFPLTKANSISISQVSNIYEVSLKFKNDDVLESKYANGKLVKSSKVNNVFFFTKEEDLNEFALKLGDVVHLSKEQKRIIPLNKAKSIRAEYNKFINSNMDDVEATISAVKAGLSTDLGIFQSLFTEILKIYEDKKIRYANANAAYNVLKTKIDRELNLASRTYENYNHYYIVDTLTTSFLKNYTADDFEKNQYQLVEKINRDAKYRYKWNKEFKNNIGQVNLYDQLKQIERKELLKLSKANSATYNTGAYIRTFALIFGGIGGIMGTYGKFFDKNEDAFSKSTANTLFYSSAALLGSSLLWSGIVHAKIKVRENKLEKTKRAIARREDDIKTLLEKRNEKRDGTPVIHEKK